MASQRAKFTVGLFVAAGIVIAVMAIIWLGMSRFLQEGRYYVIYFNESVQGLNRDSQVKYRGVSIGRVDSIGVAPDSNLIEVVLKIETGQTLEREIVAQLKAVGITGSVFIELDRRKPDEPDRSPVLSFPARYPVVASKPAEISELLRGVDDALNQIRSLDLEGISQRFKAMLDRLNQTVADANVKALSQQLEASLKGLGRVLDEERWERVGKSVEEVIHSANQLLLQARKGLAGLQGTVDRVERLTAELEEPIRGAARNLQEASASAHRLLDEGGDLVANTDEGVSELKTRLLRVARNLESASENLNRVIESIGEQPSRILFERRPASPKTEIER
jgi:phospholipid/cholesterol/gamma-HCH transport system substrate-binding protein